MDAAMAFSDLYERISENRLEVQREHANMNQRLSVVSAKRLQQDRRSFLKATLRLSFLCES